MAITINALNISFDKKSVLKNLNFSLPSSQTGKIYCLLGPNGAGKTTFIQAILGILKGAKMSGAVKFFGDLTFRNASKYIGYSQQKIDFPLYLKLEEILNLVHTHLGLSERTLLAENLLNGFELDKLMGKKWHQLSGGQQRAFSLVVAFTGKKKLVILDEPTTGLDFQKRKALWDAVQAFKLQGGTLLLCTHDLEESSRFATDIIFLKEQQLQFLGTKEEFLKSIPKIQVSIFLPQSATMEKEKNSLVNMFFSYSSPKIETSENGVLIQIDLSSLDLFIEQFISLCKKENISLDHLRIRSASLQDVVFLT